MVIVKTPLRISFFGGGTDYPVWFRQHGGAVLATAIDKFIYIQCRMLPPFHEHKHRIIYSKIEEVQNIGDIRHPAVRETLKYMNVVDGLEIHHSADLPAYSGMGSSSSFVVGLLHALHVMKNEKVNSSQLAEKAIYVEQKLIGEAVGCQDQLMAAYGGFNQIKFNTNGSFLVHKPEMTNSRVQELQNHLMLFYTGIKRIASTVAAEQIKNTPNRERELKLMEKMVGQGLSIMQGSGPIEEFGRLLHEGWQLKKAMSSKITNPIVDELYEAGIRAGASGGKLLGAGNGGFMLFFVSPEKQLQVKRKLEHLLHVDFRFEPLGSELMFSKSAS